MQNGINIKELEAVIFDLDGSLVDSMWMWKKIDMEYLERFGISLPENLQQEIEGMSFVETAGYFKEHFHITLSQYITHLRLEHAKQLLQDTDIPVTEIAMQSGYQNVSYFIRSFKKAYSFTTEI